MPVGDIGLPKKIYPIEGVEIGVAQAGVRYANRDDLTIFKLSPDIKTAVVTTQNQFAAAPVQLVREYIQQADTRYLLINTGNANAASGQDGVQRAQQTCVALAEKTALSHHQAVLPFSTGVIGETLNHQAIINALDSALADLSHDHWLRAANAIKTTDVIEKVASEKIELDGQSYYITGIAKGAGMIRPNMATMLAFVATDIAIAPALLQKTLQKLVDSSFNRISVDGDTSTNDCCVLMSGAKTPYTITDESDVHYDAVYQALQKVFIRLAQLIVRDGEGATKFITVNVTGGAVVEECTKVAYAVAHSPLVKTAFFASDPNWGRILAAVGYAGVPLEQSRVNVSLNDVLICQRGSLAEGYTEQQGQEVMSRPEIVIHIDLGRGQATDTVYTCDLSYEYVKINADYRS